MALKNSYGDKDPSEDVGNEVILANTFEDSV